MAFTFLDDPEEARQLGEHLDGEERIALDLEAAGFHRYSDRICLVQISTADDTWILDPLALDAGPVLKPILEDPEVQILMHGADFDLRLLDRDLGIGLRGLFDTQVAAALLGERALGLSSLLESQLGIELSKKYQRADWAKRPLPKAMLDYAAADTRHLHALADRLRERLVEKGRLEWAREEFRELETVRWETDSEDEDPVTKVKGARDLGPRQIAVLREALAWRDRIARDRDRAAFRVAGDRVLLDVAQGPPASVEELERMKGMSGGLARDEGEALIERIREAASRSEDDLTPYPVSRSEGSRRPPPEVEDLVNRLRAVRNRRSDELGIDRGTLLSNAVLLEIAQHEPENLEELREVPGLRDWQVEALGEELLERMGVTA